SQGTLRRRGLQRLSTLLTELDHNPYRHRQATRDRERPPADSLAGLPGHPPHIARDLLLSAPSRFSVAGPSSGRKCCPCPPNIAEGRHFRVPAQRGGSSPY